MGQEFRKKGSAPKKGVDYQQDLEETLLRFKSAFELFLITEKEEKKKYYLTVMNNELSILDEIANSVERKGIRKQEMLFSKDAKQYIENQNLENQKNYNKILLHYLKQTVGQVNSLRY